MTTHRSSVSTEYLGPYPIDFTVAGVPTNPTSDTVEFAVPPAGSPPATWVAGAWETVGTEYRARGPLTGPGGDFVLAAGIYAVWVRITDNPERPAWQVDTLVIDGGAPLASLDELRTFMADSTDIDPDQAQLMLAIASQAVRSLTGQVVSRVDNDSLALWAGWGCELWLPELPIRSVTSITIEGTLIAASTYRWSKDGRVSFSPAPAVSSSVPANLRQATIMYSHGHDPVPWDVKGVCLELARRAILSPEAGTVESETVGAYSVRYSKTVASSLTDADESRLWPYRVLVVA